MTRGEALAAAAPHGASRAPSLHHLRRLAAATDALSRGGQARSPLRGRHVALLPASRADARGNRRLDVVEAAAVALGARTARPSLAHPYPDADLAMLAGLYQLVCSDGSLGDLATRIRQLGVPVAQGLLEPYHAVSLVALLLALQGQVRGAPIVLDCAYPAQAAGATLATDAAAMLGIALTYGAAPVPDAWRLVAAPGGYAAWQLQPPAGVAADPARWNRELNGMCDLALQAALLQAVA